MLLSRSALLLGLLLSLPVIAPGQEAPQSDASTSIPTELRLPTLFSDHLVLQRSSKVPVWGWAAPGEKVTVTLKGAETTGTATASASADSRGKWKVELGPFSAGGPYELLVQAPSGSRTLQDVLIGEVWLCSGQSNMEFALGRAQNAAEAIAQSANSQIRLCKVPRRPMAAPQDDMPKLDGWKVCDPETVKTFSAVGYFFGQKLQKELGVPVGLIESSVGGTPVEAWTSADGLKSAPEFRTALANIRQDALTPGKSVQLYKKRLAAWQKQLNEKDPGWGGPVGKKAGASAAGTTQSASANWKWAAADLDTSDWKPFGMPGKWEPGSEGDYDGSFWYRGEVEVPAAMAGKDLTLALGGIDDDDITWFNGQEVGHGHGYKNVRRYKVPASLVKAGRNSIAIRVLDSGSTTGFFARPDEMRLEANADGAVTSISLAGTWKWKKGVDLAQLPRKPLDSSTPWSPTSLYNGMISPLVGYAMRGATWYQGEANAPRAYQYRRLFPGMIRDWRHLWGQGEFPFLYVQLANFTPAEDTWPELREAQMMALKVPNTAMASAVDVGNPTDIHPKDKQTVGNRLAQAALTMVYGRPGEPMGPIYRAMKKEGSAIRLSFDHAGAGLVAKGGELKGFTVAGADRKFVPATAKIEKNEVVVSSPDVPQPETVRYGWTSNCDVNLYNQEGLPASPFRTDDWPGITEKRK